MTTVKSDSNTTYLARVAASQARRLRWWREARFGMFIHWGLYSQLGRNEWVMNLERIPHPAGAIFQCRTGGAASEAGRSLRQAGFPGTPRLASLRVAAENRQRRECPRGLAGRSARLASAENRREPFPHNNAEYGARDGIVYPGNVLEAPCDGIWRF